jgi:hypothetical protein
MLFIHIGMHKAGSSSIQAFLSENAERLAERGVLYPQAGRSGPAHHDLSQPLRSGEVVPEWTDIAKTAADRTVILSSEAFCGCDPALVRQAAGEVEVRILCWQRNAAEGVVSRYAQNTKRGNNLDPFEVFFSRVGDREHLLIAPLLGRWAEVFGAQAIRVRSLDAEVLAGGDLIVDLLEALGQSDSPELVRPGPQNISPGWRALETIRTLNRRIVAAGEPDDRALRFMRKAMPRSIARAELKLGLYERGAYLDREQAGVVVERYNADIAALEGSGMDARLKPLTLDQVAVSTEPLTEAAITPDEALSLMQAAMVELAGEDFRNWR